ncbi:hypothetical protein EGW08_005563, partial [Elysia chlorotica]
MVSTMKRLTFLWGALLFMVTMLMLYMMLDTLNMAPRQGKIDTEVMSMLESKLSKVEKDMNSNRFIVQQIKAEMGALLNPSETGLAGKSDTDVRQVEAPVEKGNAGDGKLKDVVAAKNEETAMEKPKSRHEEPYAVAPRSKAPVTSDDVCQWSTQAKSTADINVHELLRSLAFDNPNGGAWTQGWKVSYPGDRWTADKKLKVILVPHT